MIAAPAEGVHLVIGGGAALRRAGQRAEACAVIVVGREAAMLAPDVDGTVVGEGGLPSHPPADLLDDPPVGHRHAGERDKDRKSTRLHSGNSHASRMPSYA